MQSTKFLHQLHPLQPFLPLAFAVSLTAAIYFLSHIAYEPTQRILLLASLPYVVAGLARIGWLAATRGDRGGILAEIPSERSRRYWAIAALEVAKMVLKVFAARRNELWLWTSVEVFVPAFSAIVAYLRPLQAPEKPLDRQRQLITLALLALLAVLPFAARLVDGVGLFLAILSAAADGAAQQLAREHVAKLEDEIDAQSTAELVGETGLRSLAIFVVTYLALFPLGLHDSAVPYGIYRRPTYEHLFPFFALLAHVFLLLSTSQSSAPSSTLMTSVYAGATASVIALSVLTGSKTAESPYFLTALLVGLVALTFLAYQPSRLALEPEDDDQPSSSSSAFTHPLLRLAPLFPYALFIFSQLINPSTFDIVVAHYDKPLPFFSDHLERVYTAPLIRQSRRRTIVYHKGNLTEDALWSGLGGVLREGTDEIYLLPNYGREGGTYLEHLIARYDPTSPSSLNPYARPLAHHTLFLQPHMAWDWIAGSRLLYTLNPRTGFVSLSKYLTNLCGKDSEQGAVYGGLKKVFEEVKGRECREDNEEDRVLQTWSGQFVVSRERVRRNERGVYERLKDVIEVRARFSSRPPSSSCANPAFGHALERSWPLLLHCPDTRIAMECADDGWRAGGCQCWD
ncbi:Proteophosphoglycan ppg4 [Rhodotorula toruloides ATCC 204091]|uniref:BY PROTMAP: gi/342318965/gb/EGU10917.1/ Proteophosphoglycan ppg4 [Rhodotorula glutinis ATCC 204091] n=1 Tax=Rhodotorula toruloides TaxID=5286 RepID=A0A0K3CQV5_RHOTO|nr:Proteophosphoglycan ppg4 [Rhodotorula toruloides ATCC 204091]